MDAVGIDAVRVRGEQGKLRLAHGGVEIWDAIVVLVISDRCSVVLHCVHRRDNRIHAVARDLCRHVGKRISLQQVAAVEKNDSSRIGSANRVHDCSCPSQTPRCFGLVSVIVPSSHAAVHVGGGGDDKIDRRSRIRYLRGSARHRQKHNEANRRRTPSTPEKLISLHELQS